MTGAELKANHGQRRFIFLKNDQPLELIYDINAVMRHESLFEVPLSAMVEPIRKRVTDEVTKLAPEGESQQVIAQRIAAALARELVRERLASGHIKDLAEWAYCLTETYREDHEIDMSWKEFRRQLHEPPPTGAATVRAQKKLEKAMAWMMAVAEVRAREEIDDEGNDLADEASPGAPSGVPSESTGTPFTTSAPSNTDGQTGNSGA